jgi:hypothetical protein
MVRETVHLYSFDRSYITYNFSYNYLIGIGMNYFYKLFCYILIVFGYGYFSLMLGMSDEVTVLRKLFGEFFAAIMIISLLMDMGNKS